jgi:hypothetical protein
MGWRSFAQIPTARQPLSNKIGHRRSSPACQRAHAIWQTEKSGQAVFEPFWHTDSGPWT